MPLKFRQQLIADERYESVGVFDVNNDGVLDIVSGAWWYEGPAFTKKHPIGQIKAEGEYFDDFSTIPLDVNGDGRMDFITGGWWGETLRWRENPGDPNAKSWTEHVIAKTGPIETTRAWDVDRDGQLEIVPNTPNGPLMIYKLRTDSAGLGTGEFQAHQIHAGMQGHGLGFGDVSGSGRGDFVMAHGWLEAPGDPYREPWTYHKEFDLGSASVPVLVADINNDGLSELIVGQAHKYGLSWWEQRRKGGQREWIAHPIDPYNSQYHDMQWVDIDGDGQCELVTGKRYRAHCDNDPGAFDEYGSYYFKWNGESFSKQVISFGPARRSKGLGIFFNIVDLNGDGRPEIIAPGKDGLSIFWNEGL